MHFSLSLRRAEALKPGHTVRFHAKAHRTDNLLHLLSFQGARPLPTPPGNPGVGAFPGAKYLSQDHLVSLEGMAAANTAANATILRWQARTKSDRLYELELTLPAPNPFSIHRDHAERPAQMFDQPARRGHGRRRDS
ncbi:MAG: hypothetical protein RLZZ244_1786 [Verrucomicrobiota bacterium]